MRRVITGILCCLLVILLMSHNTFAFDVNTLVGLPSQVGFTSMNCNAGVTCNSSTNNGVFNQINVTFYAENSQLATLVAGRYVEFNVYMFKLQDGASMHAVLAGLTTAINSNVKILSAHFETLDTNTGVIRIVGYVMNNTSTAILTFGSGSLVLRASEEVRPGTWTEWQRQNISVDVDIDEQAIIDAIEDSAAAQSEQYDKEQAAVDNIENQTTDDTADELPDMSNATSLLGNIQSIFTQIGNIPPSNCTIPANWGNLNLGDISLCTGKENMPFIVTFGAYAFELIFVIGASIILVKQVVNMFDWARGDN